MAAGGTRGSPQSVLNRLELLLDWHGCLVDSLSPELVAATLDRQLRHGKSRSKFRPKGKVAPKQPCVSLPPKDLELLLANPVWSVADTLAFGSQRTVRVYDISGACMWLLPARTLTALLTQGVSAPVPADPAAACDSPPLLPLPVTPVEDCAQPEDDETALDPLPHAFTEAAVEPCDWGYCL